jgi:two-component system chemotaxis sensor kinase CheA
MDDNSQYRDLFFEETDEYLQTLNECLLQLEKEPNDTNVLNEIFRAAHTLKGMAATMGYSTMTKLTHSMENVFELFRKGISSINSDVISLIFKCLDKLSEIVEDLRDENYKEYDISDLLSELQNVSKGQASATPQVKNAKSEVVRNKLSDTDNMIIKSAQDKGFNVYDIIVVIESGCILKGARSYLVVNKLEQEGEITYTEPNTEKLEEGDFGDSFRLIYISKLSKDKVEEIINNIAEIERVDVQLIDDKISIATEQPHSEAIKESHVDNGEATKKQQHHTNQTIRVDLSKLDNFMNLVSELVIYRTRLEDLSDSQSSEIKEPLEHVARITSDLQDLVLKIRMEPVNIVFNRFPRMIRDLSKELNKKMELEIYGEDTELDRTVVSELGEPLIHLIRNAADHGIESVEERHTLGKPEEGLIKLSAHQEGNRVVITVSDDGKGIDPKAIRDSAERKGIDTKGLGEKDLIQLIFNQGFSTAKKVTNVSGRGVGMDVVKQKISSLGGSIEVISEINKGTSFVIKLPLTLSIIQALLVNIGKEIFAIPLGIIEKVVKIGKEEILKTHKSEVYIYRGRAIPVIRLNEKLSIESTDENNHIIITLLGNQYYGLIVDGLLGQQEIVIKKLTGILKTRKEYLGATILGNGDIILILDVGNLCSESVGEKVG